MQENKATAKPLNQAIEIHDSVLGSIEVVDRTVTLNLAPAYIHTSLGEPGADPGSGWTQNVTVVIEDGIAEVKIPNPPGDLSDGSLTIGLQSSSNTMPLPLQCEDSVRLKLQ
jgi:hypothetical protein